MRLITLSKILTVSACVLCLWTGYQIWTTPIPYQSVTTAVLENGDVIEQEVVKLKQFSEVSGLGVLPLAIPLVIVLLAAWAAFALKRLALFCATFVLLIFCNITGFSIGMAYLPVLLLLILATVSSLIYRADNEPDRS